VQQDLARTAYEAYARSRGGKSFVGDNLKNWDAMGNGVKAGWDDAVEAVLRAVATAPDDDASAADLS
jgi:hypothetical protein